MWKMGDKADGNDWRKGVTAFGCAKGHSVKEVAEFAGVSKASMKSGQTAQFFDARVAEY